MAKTKVIFKMLGADAIALFPQEPGTSDFYTTCQSYMHIGQHSSASVELADLKAANEDEYSSLKRELESIGYELEIGKKFTQKDLEYRRAAVKGYSKEEKDKNDRLSKLHTLFKLPQHLSMRGVGWTQIMHHPLSVEMVKEVLKTHPDAIIWGYNN